MVFSGIRQRNQFAILTPHKLAAPGIFRNAEPDTGRHDELFAAMQRLRGRTYVNDGAVQAGELTADGRHQLDVDEHSWHVLSLDHHGRVVGCLRYQEASHTADFENLAVRHAALARCPNLGAKFRQAVEVEMKRARQMQIRFGEVGGWAVAEDHRRTLEPLRIILATYGFLQLLGSCAGVATATFRHSSAMILQKIGLTSLLADGEPLPPYYDPHYRCQMQVLQFDSRFPNPKYHSWMLELAAGLRTAPVISRDHTRVAALQPALRRIEMPAVEPYRIPAFAPLGV
jgi:hypothetical protein